MNKNNCPSVLNPDQSDINIDGWGDVCDHYYDNHGVLDTIDNRLYDVNSDQVDAEADRIGDVRDPIVDADRDDYTSDVD